MTKMGLIWTQDFNGRFWVSYIDNRANLDLRSKVHVSFIPFNTYGGPNKDTCCLAQIQLVDNLGVTSVKKKKVYLISH